MQAELWRILNMSNEKVARFNKQHYVVGLKETLKALIKIKLHH